MQVGGGALHEAGSVCCEGVLPSTLWKSPEINTFFFKCLHHYFKCSLKLILMAVTCLEVQLQHSSSQFTGPSCCVLALACVSPPLFTQPVVIQSALAFPSLATSTILPLSCLFGAKCKTVLVLQQMPHGVCTFPVLSRPLLVQIVWELCHWRASCQPDSWDTWLALYPCCCIWDLGKK